MAGLPYSSLTPAQKAILDNFANFERATMGELARVLNHIKTMTDDTLNALAILSTLDPAAVVPNASGLAGAADLNAYEIGFFHDTLEAIRQTVDLNNGTLAPISQFRSQASKAAGINAMSG